MQHVFLESSALRYLKPGEYLNAVRNPHRSTCECRVRTTGISPDNCEATFGQMKSHFLRPFAAHISTPCKCNKCGFHFPNLLKINYANAKKAADAVLCCPHSIPHTYYELLLLPLFSACLILLVSEKSFDACLSPMFIVTGLETRVPCINPEPAISVQ